MINILIGIFYIALIAIVSYLLYYIIKLAIKDAYYEIEYKSTDDTQYENTSFVDKDEKNTE